MSQSNGVIAAPVDASDPYYAMGIGQYNGQFDIGWACNNGHGKINPFAKYKPVRLPSMFGSLQSGYFRIEGTAIDFPYSTDWFRSINMHCGFNIPSTIITQNFNQPDALWTYEPPNADYPYRLLDFEGYNHNAPKDLFRLSAPENVYVNNSYTVSVYVNPIENNGSLSLLQIFADDSALTFDSLMCVSIRSPSNPYGSYVEKKIKLAGGHNRFDFTADDMRLGLVVGGDIWIHAYIEDNNRRIFSLNTNNNQTVFKASVISSAGFSYYSPRGVVLKDPDTSYLYYLVNLGFGITAIGYSGGTQTNTTYLKFFRFVKDDTVYQNEYELWKSQFFQPLTVTAGNTTSLPLPYSITVDTSVDPFETAIVIWYTSGGSELSRLKVQVQRGRPS